MPPSGNGSDSPNAAAAGYDLYSQGDCAVGQPRGVSTLNWWGYFPLSEGHTTGYLSKIDPGTGSIIAQVQGSNSYRGADGNAQVDLTAAYTTGSWRQTGEHTSTFFPGTDFSYGNYFSCP